MAPATYPFYAGSSTPADAEFSVDKDGNVVAESIAISGTFTVTGYSSGTDPDPWDVTTADWKGVWLGKNGGKYKLFIGNEASQYLSWDDSTLSISGVVTIDDEGFDMGGDGRIVGKESGTDSDPFGGTADWVGVWLGADGSTHKFFAGDETGEFIMFDGSDVTISGDLEMANGSIEIVNGSDTIWLNRTAGELRIGGTSYSGAPFQVSAAGALEATSGEIGGVTIGTDRMTIGSGGSTAGMIKGEANGIAFYAGSATPLSAEFWVKTDGSVHCENIAASGGTVGGFTIATHLYTGSKTAYNDNLAGVHIGTDGIGIKDTFKVSAAGVLTCSGATIRGTLVADDVTTGTMNFSRISAASVEIISTMMGTNSVANAAIAQNAVRTDEIQIDGNLTFYGTNSIIGIDKIFYSTTGALTGPYIQFASTALTLYSGSTVGNDIVITSVDDVSIVAAGDLLLSFNSDGFVMQTADATSQVTLKVGHTGEIKCLIGGVTRYIAFREEA